jgi:hypothetical protein
MTRMCWPYCRREEWWQVARDARVRASPLQEDWLSLGPLPWQGDPRGREGHRRGVPSPGGGAGGVGQGFQTQASCGLSLQASVMPPRQAAHARSELVSLWYLSLNNTLFLR